MIDENELYRRIGERLRAIRTDTKGAALTQDALAKRIGLERTSITNIEAGKQKLPIHVLYSLCAALGVDVAEVLPPQRDLVTGPHEERVRVGDSEYSVPAQIADLVRRTR